MEARTSDNIYETSTGVAKFDSVKDAQTYLNNRVNLDMPNQLIKLMNQTPNAPVDLYVAAAEMGVLEDAAFQQLVAQVQNDALKVRIEQEDSLALQISDSIFSGFKGVSRNSLGFLDMFGEVTKNMMAAGLQESFEDRGSSGVLTYAGGIVNFIRNIDKIYYGVSEEDKLFREEMFKSTQFGYALSEALTTGDWDKAFGEEAMGSGFIIDQQGRIANESEEYWTNLYTLANGDGATVGRIIAQDIGLEKNSSAYNLVSGTVDFFNTVVNDPINVIPFGSFSKVGRAGKVASVSDIDALNKLEKLVPGSSGVIFIKLSNNNVIQVPKTLEGDIPPVFKLEAPIKEGDIPIYSLDETAEVTTDMLFSETGRMFSMMIDDPENFQKIWGKLDNIKQNFENEEDFLTFAREAFEAGDISQAYKKIDDFAQQSSEEILVQKQAVEELIGGIKSELDELRMEKFGYSKVAEDAPPQYVYKEIESASRQLDEAVFTTPAKNIDEAVENISQRIEEVSGSKPVVAKEGSDNFSDIVNSSDNVIIIKQDGNIEAIYKVNGTPLRKSYTREKVAPGEATPKLAAETPEEAFGATQLATPQVDELNIAGTPLRATDEVEPQLAAKQLLPEEEARLIELEELYAAAIEVANSLKFGVDNIVEEISKLRKSAGSNVAKKIEELKKAREEKLKNLTPEEAKTEVLKENVKAYLGISADAKTVKGLAFFMDILGDRLDGFIDALIYLNSPAVIRTFMPKLSTKSLVSLADATTKEEVIAVLGRIYAQGEWSNASARGVTWYADMGRTLNNMDGPKGVTKKMNNTRRVYLGKNNNVPAAFSVSSENADDMVDLMSNAITFLGRMFKFQSYKKAKALLDFHDEQVNLMIRATTASQRKTIYIQAVRRMITEFTPGWEDLPPNIRKQFMDDFNNNLANVNETMHRNANMEAVGDLSLEVSPNRDMILFYNQLNFNVQDLDWVKLRDYINFGVKITKDKKLAPVPKRRLMKYWYSGFFDAFVKPSLLFGRPGYLFYNLNVSQAVMTMYGMTVLARHPWQTLALSQAINNNEYPLIGKYLQKFNVDGVGADGRKLIDADVEEDVRVLINSEQAKRPLAQIRASSFGRIDSMAAIIASNNNRVKKIFVGQERLFPGEKGFDKAVAENAQSFLTANIHQNVLAILLNNPPAWLIKMAKENGMNIQDTLVKYYHSGEGRKVLDNIIEANWGDKPEVMFSGKYDNIPNFSTEAGVKEYLFGDSNYSVGKLVRDYTNDLDSDVIDALQMYLRRKEEILKSVTNSFSDNLDVVKIPKELKELILPNGKKIEMSDPDAFIDELTKILQASWDNPKKATRKPVGATQPKWKELNEPNTPISAGRKVFGKFFELTGRLEYNVSHSVAFYQSHWQAVSERIVLLSPDDAKKVLARAEEEFANVKSPFTKDVMKLMRENAKRAIGDGSYTIDDLTVAADNFASRMQEDMFYQAWKRNQIGYATRLVSPFLQAHGNGYKVFANAAARFPERAYRAQKLYVGLNETDSNSVYETLGFDYDPSQGFIWQDDNGVKYFSVPLLGYAKKFLGVQPGPKGQFNVRLDSWNPVNLGEYLPGVGPALTFPYTMLDNMFPSFSSYIPPELESALVPYKATNKNQEQWGILNNSWLRIIERFGLGAFHGDFFWRKDVAPAMAALVYANPDKYTTIDPDTGTRYFNQGGEIALATDAESMARWMQVGHALSNMIFRSGQNVQYTKGLEGETIAVAAIEEEYKAAYEESGNRTQAQLDMISKYGLHNVFFFMSPNEYLSQGTTEGMRFVRDNREFAEDVSDVVGYFFDPIDGTEASVNFSRWQSDIGKGKFKDPIDMVNSINWILMRVRISNVDRRRNLDINDPEYLTKEGAEALKDAYRNSIKGVDQEVTINFVQTRIQNIEKALTNEELANTPAGIAASQYLSLRQEALENADGTSIGGKKDKWIRDELKRFGNNVSEDVPEFKSMWENILLKELEYYDGRE
jgi:hypothetical protein